MNSPLGLICGIFLSPLYLSSGLKHPDKAVTARDGRLIKLHDMAPCCVITADSCQLCIKDFRCDGMFFHLPLHTFFDHSKVAITDDFSNLVFFQDGRFRQVAVTINC